MLDKMKARTVAAFVVVLSAGLLIGAASPASAAGNAGNAGNAKNCQKGGWQTLQTASGGAFANQGECVNYAAKGGQFGTPCYGSTLPNHTDLKLTGPIDTLNDISAYYSFDGTCSGALIAFATFVSAADATEAGVKCAAVSAGSAFGFVSTFGYSTVPSDWFQCSRVDVIG